MPCYDARDRLSNSEKLSEIRELQERLDIITNILCKLTDNIDITTLTDLQLVEWIMEHRESDKQRKQIDTK